MGSRAALSALSPRAKQLVRYARSSRGLRPPHMLEPRLRSSDRLREADVPTRVAIRDDRVLEVNGKPFFPNGLYYADADIADASGERLQRLKAMGFNLLFVEGGL